MQAEAGGMWVTGRDEARDMQEEPEGWRRRQKEARGMEAKVAETI